MRAQPPGRRRRHVLVRGPPRHRPGDLPRRRSRTTATRGSPPAGRWPTTSSSAACARSPARSTRPRSPTRSSRACRRRSRTASATTRAAASRQRPPLRWPTFAAGPGGRPLGPRPALAAAAMRRARASLLALALPATASAVAQAARPPRPAEDPLVVGRAVRPGADRRGGRRDRRRPASAAPRSPSTPRAGRPTSSARRCRRALGRRAAQRHPARHDDGRVVAGDDAEHRAGDRPVRAGGRTTGGVDLAGRRRTPARSPPPRDDPSTAGQKLIAVTAARVVRAGPAGARAGRRARTPCARPPRPRRRRSSTRSRSST